MSIYRFSPSSAVPEVTFRYANDRPPVALLTAGQGASSDQLSVVRRAMLANGWSCVPVHAEKRDVLQVSGFHQESHLLNFMQAYHFAEGKPEYTAESGDHPTRTAGEWLQDRSLQAAGILNLVGDVALLASGVMSGRGHEITAGALYTAGAGVLARYGNVKTEHHVREVCERTAKFLKKQAGELPEDCGLFTIWKQSREGALKNIESLFYRYPSEVMLGAYTLGAFTMLQSGLKQGNPWGVAYGANSVAMKAASLMIPEKQIATEKKEAHKHMPVQRFIDWVQEKPLRVFGFGSLVTDTLLGLSAFREYKSNPQQKSYIFKFVTTGTYLLADALMAVSNKNHVNADGKFDADEQRSIEALVAETIVRQPKELRAPLTHHVAGFLSTQPEMKGGAIEIGKAIEEQIARITHNPWACRTSDGSLQPGNGYHSLL